MAHSFCMCVCTRLFVCVRARLFCVSEQEMESKRASLVHFSYVFL